jgi:hypothetical protein
MTHIPALLRRLVSRRSRGRCEYCQLAQAGQEATFHVDHVQPVIAGGRTEADNLALACVSCSLRKGARQTAVDPDTGHVVSIYHPRSDTWSDHFVWQGVRVLGLTEVGRATIDALDLNRPLILAIREEEAALGRHPRAIP